MNSKTVKFGSGEVTVIECGKIRVHVYNTKDAIDDQVIILERKGLVGSQGVVIEQPCFKDTIREMERYISDSRIKMKGKLVAYHAAGASFLPGVPVYMTEGAIEYNTRGAGKGLVDKFTGAFGDAFDNGITGSGNRIGAGKLTIAGIDMVINPDNEAYEVEIPSIKAVYMHMLGHDCHSIVAGPGHADAIIANLNRYLEKGYELFLSSHYGPETRKDVQTKIDYLEDLKAIAKGCSSAQEFMDAVNAKYKGYSGANYLEMTAGFFFPQ